MNPGDGLCSCLAEPKDDCTSTLYHSAVMPEIRSLINVKGNVCGWLNPRQETNDFIIIADSVVFYNCGSSEIPALQLKRSKAVLCSRPYVMLMISCFNHRNASRALEMEPSTWTVCV